MSPRMCPQRVTNMSCSNTWALSQALNKEAKCDGLPSLNFRLKSQPKMQVSVKTLQWGVKDTQLAKQPTTKKTDHQDWRLQTIFEHIYESTPKVNIEPYEYRNMYANMFTVRLRDSRVADLLIWKQRPMHATLLMKNQPINRRRKGTPVGSNHNQ